MKKKLKDLKLIPALTKQEAEVKLKKFKEAYSDLSKVSICLHCGFVFDKGPQCPECSHDTEEEEERKLSYLQGYMRSDSIKRSLVDEMTTLTHQIFEYGRYFYQTGWANAKWQVTEMGADAKQTAHIAIKLLDILAAMGIRNELRDILDPLFQVAPDLIDRMQKCYKDRNGPEASDGGSKNGWSSRQTSAESSSKEKEEDDKAQKE